MPAHLHDYLILDYDPIFLGACCVYDTTALGDLERSMILPALAELVELTLAPSISL